jgi:parallel beta-helix repeat protein
MRYLTIIFCSVLVLFSLHQAQAKIIHVPDDSSTIQAGINGAGNGDTVLVAEGHYWERINFYGKSILVTSEFMNDGDTSHTQNTIIDADVSVLGTADSASVVIFCSGEDSSSIIQGFTILNGLGTGPSSLRRGGGIYCTGFSSPTIFKCTITGNNAHDGGGICCFSASSPTIHNNTITDNLCGGILCAFCDFPTITDNTITDNRHWSGIASVECDSLTIANNIIRGNYGGGIHLSFTSPPSTENVTITNNIISGNSGTFGGGIFCTDIGPPSITLISHNTITDCSAYYGGGIYCKDFSSPTMVHNTISRNHAEVGGGIHCGKGSSPILRNTIVAFSTRGSAVHCEDATANPILTCCDIYGNADGDWVGCIQDQFGVNGNISCDPFFCYPDTGNYYLNDSSCCVGAGCDSLGNPDSTVDIGAWGVGCGYLRGDTNGDGVIDIADVMYLINHLFIGGSPPQPMEAGDCNCDEVVDVADVMYLINYLFIGGSPPCEP